MSFSIPRSISIHNLKMLSLNSNIKVKIKITGLQKKGNVEKEKLSVNRYMHRGWVPCLEDIVSRSKLNQWSHGPQLTQIKGHLLIVHLIPDIYKNIQVKIKNLCRRSVIRNFLKVTIQQSKWSFQTTLIYRRRNLTFLTISIIRANQTLGTWVLCDALQTD